MHQGADYWKNYMECWFGADLIGRWERHCSHDEVSSGARPMHMQVYDTGDPTRPTLVFSHGIAGYARVLAPFLLPLREQGINIVAPDLRSYGYNRDRKGDFEWDTHARNLGDAVAYARQRFTGKLLQVSVRPAPRFISTWREGSSSWDTNCSHAQELRADPRASHPRA